MIQNREILYISYQLTELVSEFVYLGSVIEDTCGSYKDVGERIVIIIC